ncbi:MAG TPA: hydroxyisourate hydrolase [Jiangellales bacterium]|nr:hydroxyisourate hydrolase [Jiangellales bacterium]
MVTTHVLDTARGRPAAGVAVRLEGPDGGLLAEAVTDEDGRVGALGPDELPPGSYRLVFQTGAYFASLAQQSFYPRVSVEFEIAEPGAHYHVPLLVSPYGFTTYRGS